MVTSIFKSVILIAPFVVLLTFPAAGLGGLLTTVTGLSSNPDDVKFYLFQDKTSSNKYQEIKYGNVSSLINSGLNKDLNSVVFVIHGFMSNVFDLPFPMNVVNAYLREGTPSNIIAVDWSKLGQPMFNDPLMYPIAAGNVGIVGKRVGEFITFLRNNSAISGPSQVHLVGHSLGSHVSGRAGKYVQGQGLESIARISGLDPAGPGFQYIPAEYRLVSDDATFVDTIHTSLTLGYIGSVGDVSFYANGGGPFQPNCDTIIDPVHLTGICAHNKVGEYFAYSIRNHTISGCKCSEAFHDLCNASCDQTMIFGEYCPTTATGSYDVEIVTTAEDLLI